MVVIQGFFILSYGLQNAAEVEIIVGLPRFVVEHLIQPQCFVVEIKCMWVIAQLFIHDPNIPEAKRTALVISQFFVNRERALIINQGSGVVRIVEIDITNIVQVVGKFLQVAKAFVDGKCLFVPIQGLG